jgi:hypothetical protein
MKRLAILLLALLTTAAYARRARSRSSPPSRRVAPCPSRSTSSRCATTSGRSSPWTGAASGSWSTGRASRSRSTTSTRTAASPPGTSSPSSRPGRPRSRSTTLPGMPTDFESAFSRSGDDPVVLRSDHCDRLRRRGAGPRARPDRRLRRHRGDARQRDRHPPLQRLPREHLLGQRAARAARGVHEPRGRRHAPRRHDDPRRRPRPRHRGGRVRQRPLRRAHPAPRHPRLRDRGRRRSATTSHCAATATS